MWAHTHTLVTSPSFLPLHLLYEVPRVPLEYTLKLLYQSPMYNCINDSCFVSPLLLWGSGFATTELYRSIWPSGALTACKYDWRLVSVGSFWIISMPLSHSVVHIIDFPRQFSTGTWTWYQILSCTICEQGRSRSQTNWSDAEKVTQPISPCHSVASLYTVFPNTGLYMPILAYHFIQ